MTDAGPGGAARSPRVLVTGWFGAGNAGDELILAAVRDKLSSQGVDVVALAVDPQATEAEHGVPAVRHARPHALWRAMRQSDALLVGGGGLVQDETSLLSLPYHMGVVGLARLRRLPVAAVGLGAAPLRSRVSRALVRAALGPVPVAARDADSVDVLRDAGVDDVRLGLDLVLGGPAVDVPPADRIVACLRPWSGRGGIRRARAGWGRAPLAAELAAALDRVARQLDLPVSLVAFEKELDEAYAGAVAGRMHAEADVVCPQPHEVLEAVGASRVVIAMRYHGGVAAARTSRPAVLVGYSSKVGSLARELGMPLVAATPEGVALLPGAVEAALASGRAALGEAERQRRAAVNDEIVASLVTRAARAGSARLP